MPRRRSKPRISTRSIIVKPQSSYERDLFLEMAMPMTEELDVLLDTAMGRIELEIRGTADAVNTMISKLSDLESQVIAALYPDRDGYYLYHASILTNLCRPPVNLDLFSAAISSFGFDTAAVESNLRTEAPVEDLTSIHKQIVILRNQILGEFNRDIERFFVIIALTANTEDVKLIVDTAIDLEVIKETEYGFQFTTSLEDAKNKVLEQLGIELRQALHLSEEVELNNFSFADLGFDGGKIVFMKDGKEIEDPEFEE